MRIRGLKEKEGVEKSKTARERKKERKLHGNKIEKRVIETIKANWRKGKT